MAPPPGQAQDKILYVDDEPQNLELFRMQFGDDFPLLTAADATEALAILGREEISVILTDERMPGMRGVDLLAKVFDGWPDVVRVIVSAYSDAGRLLLAMNRGHALEYVLKPWNADELRACIERCLALGRRRRLLARQADLGAVLADEGRRQRGMQHLVGAETGLRRTLELARRAANSDATVIIRGETGTGKELIAGFIHETSRRSTGPFVCVNCTALAEGVLESELFGHEQGAFTGAVRAHKGRFEIADGGTIFLDEIGDITPRLQAGLLRVLQERSFERVGGTKTIKVDVRVLAATHRDLRRAVDEGTFRQDLYYRLNVVPIEVPALRERREDIESLVQHFINKQADRHRRPRLGPEVAAALCAYDWPGNVRELENVVQRAVVLSQEDELTLEDFSLQLGPPVAATAAATPAATAAAIPAAAPAAPAPAAATGPLPLPREAAREAETQQLREVIVRSGGNLARAARLLGIPRTTLVSRAAKLGLL